MSARHLIVLGTTLLTGFLVGSGLAQLLAPRLDAWPRPPLTRVVADRLAPDALAGHLFARLDPPAPAPTAEGEEDLCDVPWRLVGTMLDRDRPSRSFAAIQTPEGARLIAASMTHTELTLVSLDTEAATLERPDGRRCEIRMFETRISSTTIEPLPPAPAPVSDPRVRLVSSSHVEIDPSLLTAPGALAVRAVPHMVDGRLGGVRLFGVRRSSPLAAAGVRDGDVIRSVDGQPLTDPDIALSALGRLRGGEPVRVAIERDGASREMTLSTARPR